jgi:hemolysin activation/secretion protein
VQGVSQGVPLYDLNQIQTSFKQQEGLGGAKSVRGVLKNRFAGRGMMLWNAELRYRALDFAAAGKPFHLVLSAFADAGRVWEGGLQADQLFDDLHRGYGGGLHVGMGENFTVAADAGTSSETGLQIYIGLGYLY